ncbi:MAG: AarF/UbiB family protein [Pseudomonadota bacterium]|nr:AarF/UbiB family protein [Pseudomonadota bacterium]
MSFLDTLSAGRDIRRVNQILMILAQNGLEDIADRLGFASLLTKIERRIGVKPTYDASLSAAERTVLAFQEMGPTFIKLGQLLATRVDLLPPDWIEAFETLQDRVPALPWNEIVVSAEKSLGRNPETVFDSIDKQPLAAGSIAQVHRAVLAGDNVVVKIQRPEITEIVESDLRLLNALAEWLEAQVESLQRFRPRQVVRQFATSLRRELDFTRECRASDRIRSNFEDVDYIVIPKVYWELTSPKLSVQEYLDGIPAREVDAIKAAGLDCHLLAQRSVDTFLRMALEHGFFHADPHPGNYFFLPDNRLGLIDFGLVGTLSDHRRGQLALLLNGAILGDASAVTDVLVDWADEADVDLDSLSHDIQALLDEYQGSTLAQIDMGVALGQLTTLARDYQLSLPPDLTLLIKAVTTLEALGRRLDPEFDLMSEAEPFVQRAILQRYSPESLFRRGIRSANTMLNMVTELPRDLRRLLHGMRRGTFPVEITIPELDEFGQRVEKAANRVTIGIVVAALVVGSSIALTVDAGPKLFGLPFFGISGFIVANMGGFWILYAIWRTRH